MNPLVGIGLIMLLFWIFVAILVLMVMVDLLTAGAAMTIAGLLAVALLIVGYLYYRSQ